MIDFGSRLSKRRRMSIKFDINFCPLMASFYACIPFHISQGYHNSCPDTKNEYCRLFNQISRAFLKVVEGKEKISSLQKFRDDIVETLMRLFADLVSELDEADPSYETLNYIIENNFSEEGSAETYLNLIVRLSIRNKLPLFQYDPQTQIPYSATTCMGAKKIKKADERTQIMIWSPGAIGLLLYSSALIYKPDKEAWIHVPNFNIPLNYASRPLRHIIPFDPDWDPEGYHPQRARVAIIKSIIMYTHNPPHFNTLIITPGNSYLVDKHFGSKELLKVQEKMASNHSMIMIHPLNIYETIHPWRPDRNIETLIRFFNASYQRTIEDLETNIPITHVDVKEFKNHCLMLHHTLLHEDIDEEEDLRVLTNEFNWSFVLNEGRGSLPTNSKPERYKSMRTLLIEEGFLENYRKWGIFKILDSVLFLLNEFLCAELMHLNRPENQRIFPMGVDSPVTKRYQPKPWNERHQDFLSVKELESKNLPFLLVKNNSMSSIVTPEELKREKEKEGFNKYCIIRLNTTKAQFCSLLYSSTNSLFPEIVWE